MKVPFHPLERESSYLRNAIGKRWKLVGDLGVFFHGSQESELLQKLSQALRVEKENLVLVGSGTDALMLSLLSGGIGAGDEVITSAVSAPATATAILSTGAKIIYLDIDPTTGLMDLKLLGKAISQRTKAIVPVHLYGNRVDTSKLYKGLAGFGREDVMVIEDGAQSFGSLWEGKVVDPSSTFHTFSFYPTKNLGAWGDGGLIYGPNRESIEEIKGLAFYGQKERNFASLSRGINSRMDEWQASVLIEKLEELENSFRKRDEYYRYYRDRLLSLPLKMITATTGCDPVWHLAIAKLEDSKKRENLKGFLQERGIQTLIHYPFALPNQTGLSGLGECPEAQKWCDSILSLPYSPLHRKEEIEFVAETIADFFK